jgi:hypothetical protein
MKNGHDEYQQTIKKFFATFDAIVFSKRCFFFKFTPFVHDVSMLRTTKDLIICVGTIIRAVVFPYLTPSTHTCMHLGGRGPCYLFMNLTPSETLLPRLKRGLLELLG